jgi:hypothetical protein
MPEASTMQRIKTAVALSRNPVLDLDVSLARDVSSAIDPLCVDEPRRVFLDVPLDAIVALGHKKSAIDWMESEIGTSWLPAPSATDGLCLYATGGALRCHNRMHRLVAAVCWLAASRGAEHPVRKETVVLRKVDVKMRQVHPEAVRLVGAIDAGYQVDVSSEPQGTYIRSVKRGDARYFLFDGSLKEIRPKICLRGSFAREIDSSPTFNGTSLRIRRPRSTWLCWKR